MKQTTECTKCGGGTGQSKPCVCAVARQASDALFKNYFGCTPAELDRKLKQASARLAVAAEEASKSLLKFAKACEQIELDKRR